MITLEDKIKIMQSSAEGKSIEVTHHNSKDWRLCEYPSWDWVHYDYRIAEERPPKEIFVNFYTGQPGYVYSNVEIADRAAYSSRNYGKAIRYLRVDE